MKARIAMVGAFVLVASAAQAQFQKPEDAVKYRQGSLFVMGQHFSRIGAMANGRVPFDAGAVQANAATVEYISRLPWAGFHANTKDVKSKAKSNVWTEGDKFSAAADKMMAEVKKLNEAAGSGQMEVVKAAFGSTAASCKACHDNFRE